MPIYGSATPPILYPITTRAQTTRRPANPQGFQNAHSSAITAQTPVECPPEQVSQQPPSAIILDSFPPKPVMVGQEGQGLDVTAQAVSHPVIHHWMGFDVPDATGIQLGLPMSPNALNWFRRPTREGFAASIQHKDGLDVLLSPNDKVEAYDGPYTVTVSAKPLVRITHGRLFLLRMGD
ncbi:MAG: hypothetical protein KKC18_04095 [Chloroflexi bacterium]|nr:hypothetical protein [Chloroflexota bacterium]